MINLNGINLGALGGGSSSLPIIPVQELPDPSTAKNAIYLVPAKEAGEGNLFDEYIVVNGAWEKIGQGKFTLDNYYTKEETDNKLKYV